MNRKRTKAVEAEQNAAESGGIDDSRLVRDEGVGGSNPLTPTNDLATLMTPSANDCANYSLPAPPTDE
jgi:hypothetical protein